MTKEQEGLTPEELDAETAVELPDREAMSIVGLPGGPLPMEPSPVWDDPIQTIEPVDKT
ncbi:MAG TPA: hypothetical protein VH723_07780 [Candidatus Limnocylindrales bacterium]|jgi:hypothetical protein